MSKIKRDLPAVNYAKIHQAILKPKKEVQDALTNEIAQADESSDKINLLSLKTYKIKHNNALYQGEWKEGLPNGMGICVYQDGTYLKGIFKDGELNDDKALLILPNGARYRGNVVNSQLNGFGKLQLGSYKYEGYWLNGKPHGQGQQEYGDKSKYIGNFINGLKQCYDDGKTIKEKKEYYKKHGNLPKQAYYRSDKNETYNGQFKNGLMHGFGQYYQSENEVRYCGEFFEGKKKGNAQLHTKTGTLSGNFVDDVVNGEGVYTWKDGRRYEGQFDKNQFHGKGKIYMPNNIILEGIWVNGHNKQMKTISQQEKKKQY